MSTCKDDSRVFKALLKVNQMQCGAPLPESEVRRIAQSFSDRPAVDKKANISAKLAAIDDSLGEIMIDFSIHFDDVTNLLNEIFTKFPSQMLRSSIYSLAELVAERTRLLGIIIDAGFSIDHAFAYYKANKDAWEDE